MAGRDTKWTQWTLVALIGSRNRLPPGRQPPSTTSASLHDAAGGCTHDSAASDPAAADA